MAPQSTDIEATIDRAVAKAVEAAQRNVIPRDEVREIAEEIAERAVRQTLLSLGIRAEQGENFQRDFTFLRAQRESQEAMWRHGKLVALGMIVTAVLTVLWLGLKGVIK